MKLTISTESSPQHGRWSGADKVTVSLRTKDSESAEEVQGVLAAVTALLSTLGATEFEDAPAGYHDEIAAPPEVQAAAAEWAGAVSDFDVPEFPLAAAVAPGDDLRTTTEAEADLNADRARTDQRVAGVSLSPRRSAEIGSVIQEVLAERQLSAPSALVDQARAIVFALDDRGMVR